MIFPPERREPAATDIAIGLRKASVVGIAIRLEYHGRIPRVKSRSGVRHGET